MRGELPGIRASKSLRGTSDMNSDFKWKADTAIIPPDLVIERQGPLITRVTKNGVVIWHQEPHTAPMVTDTPLMAAEIQKINEEREYLLRRPPTTANARQEGGDHYRTLDASGTCPTCKNPIQHWDWAHNLRGLEYAATKYLARWRDKGGLESLKKVIHYTQKIIEIHFPDIVVNISFSNRVLQEPRSDSQEPFKGERYFEELRKPRGQEAEGGKEMAGRPTAHQAAVDENNRLWKE